MKNTEAKILGTFSIKLKFCVISKRNDSMNFFMKVQKAVAPVLVAYFCQTGVC
jgi:hypothetical protein